ncbi:imidazole glycerol phosphate synthase subunit HisF [Actinomycetota bacterium]|nr:imidazole glycerol phosphate synthase subunit HisF [Actinomycetota bacterium]
MLTKRIIPCLDVKDGQVVKGVNFKGLRTVGDPVELAKKYYDDGADELTFLDISASIDGRGTMLDIVERTANQVFIPLTVGGGVRSVEDVTQLLNAGADKISINSSAIARPELITEIAEKFGRQVVVLSADARRVALSNFEENSDFSAQVHGFSSKNLHGPALRFDNRFSSKSVSDYPSNTSSWATSGFEVTTHGGTKSAGLDLIEWIKTAEAMGAGEVLLNSMDKDGTKSGFDLEMINLVRANTSLPIIASGGAGSAADFRTVFEQTDADAALGASIFHSGEVSIREVRELLERGS